MEYMEHQRFSSEECAVGREELPRRRPRYREIEKRHLKAVDKHKTNGWQLGKSSAFFLESFC